MGGAAREELGWNLGLGGVFIRCARHDGVP